MNRIEIKIDKIGEYSLAELKNSNYTEPEYNIKLKDFTNWEMLEIFRKRDFSPILLKVLSHELDGKYLKGLPNILSHKKRKYFREVIRELLVFPANNYHLKILMSEPESHKRIVGFINSNRYFVEYEIPKVLIDYFMSIPIGEIYWDEDDEIFMQNCYIEGTGSSYNGGSGKLAILQRGIVNGASIILANQVMKTEEEFSKWVSEKYPSFIKLMERRNKIRIIEK